MSIASAMRILIVVVVMVSWTWRCPALSAVLSEPVAASFPDWCGVEEGNRLMGWKITPSDLRHKVTVMVVFESKEKLREQLLLAARIMPMRFVEAPKGDVFNWKVSRFGIAAFSCRGDVTQGALREAMRVAKGDKKNVQEVLEKLKRNGCCYYRNLSFAGAPDPAGKCPYAYVMGPAGAEPLWHGPLTGVAVKDVWKVIVKAKKDVAALGWRPFFGSVTEPKYHPQLAKALEKGRRAKLCPLDSVANDILANVVSKDAEKAREAQILYDAINQTHNDLILKIVVEAGNYPYVASADIADLLKFWPRSRNRVKHIAEKVDSIPGIKVLSDVYAKVRFFSDLDSMPKSAGEAKKAVAELKKAQKAIAKFKDSDKVLIQNAAMTLDVKIESLIAVISSLVVDCGGKPCGRAVNKGEERV